MNQITPEKIDLLGLSQAQMTSVLAGFRERY